MTISGPEVTLIVRGREDACLAYANTLSWRGRAAPVEQLGSAGALVRWLVGSAALAGDEAGALEAWTGTHPAPAAALLADAIALRETMYQVFHAQACGDVVSDRDLTALNAALAAAPPRQRLARAGDGYGWQIGPVAISAPVLLAPVLWSAADLVTSDRRRRVRLCADAQCLWLFLDASKAGTRRWCDMAACGNRAKARRHYQRARRP
jgi:predicted RNA-binding Zn ribbon-like protein